MANNKPMPPAGQLQLLTCVFKDGTEQQIIGYLSPHGAWCFTAPHNYELKQRDGVGGADVIDWQKLPK